VSVEAGVGEEEGRRKKEGGVGEVETEDGGPLCATDEGLLHVMNDPGNGVGVVRD